MIFQDLLNANAECALEDAAVRVAYGELLTVVRDLVVPVYQGKSSRQEDVDLVHPILNAMAREWLSLADWGQEGVVAELTGGRELERGSVDFYKRMADGRYVIVEVQFGNGARLERDFAKLQKFHRHGQLALGVLVYFDRATAVTADSGLANFETACARRAELETMPVSLVGLSRQGSEVVDLRDIPGIVFPAVLGGSGENSGELHAVIARALIERQSLAKLKLPESMEKVIARHAQEHVRKTVTELKRVMDQISTCKDAQLRADLLAPFIEVLKSSYSPEPVKRTRTLSLAKAPKATIVEATNVERVDTPGVAAEIPAPPLTLPAEPLPGPKAVRIRREEVALQALERPALKPLAPGPTKRYPTEHFALASAFQAALSKSARPVS